MAGNISITTTARIARAQAKAQPLLRVDDVSVQFGGVKALKHVSFDMMPGEKLGLVGPNGAGKTTLFNSISGLVQPSAGTLSFNGYVLNRLPEYRRARLGIGRTFQVPQPLHGLTVRENLIVAQRFGNGFLNPQRVDEVMEILMLDGCADHHAENLTLAQLKALEIGKALAMQPVLLLLDEVLAGFEQLAKRNFASMLNAIHQRFAMSIVMIEHDIEAITSVCDRICVLNFGELIADGAPEAVFKDPAVVSSYTGDVIA
jgi:branched-chain amino acid transport system ATP-binding protein